MTVQQSIASTRELTVTPMSPRTIGTMPATGLAEPGGGPAWVVPGEPWYDPALGQYVAMTPAGVEVYEDTYSRCAAALAEHLEIEAFHLAQNQGEPYELMGANCATGPCYLCDVLTRAKCEG